MDSGGGSAHFVPGARRTTPPDRSSIGHLLLHPQAVYLSANVVLSCELGCVKQRTWVFLAGLPLRFLCGWVCSGSVLAVGGRVKGGGALVSSPSVVLAGGKAEGVGSWWE